MRKEVAAGSLGQEFLHSVIGNTHPGYKWEIDQGFRFEASASLLLPCRETRVAWACYGEGVKVKPASVCAEVISRITCCRHLGSWKHLLTSDVEKRNLENRGTCKAGATPPTHGCEEVGIYHCLFSREELVNLCNPLILIGPLPHLPASEDRSRMSASSIRARCICSILCHH